MNWVNITCGSCGTVAALEDFCRTPLFGELPVGHFQCPGCGVAWQRRESGYRILRSEGSATIIADRVDIVLVEGRL